MDKVCLLITIFNRSNQLENSLKRLCRLTPPDEVLVIDDGSDGDLYNDIIKQFESKLPIRYIYNNNKNWSICSMARNIGIKNTDCDIIITAEPEILFVTDVIAQMLQKHQEIPNKVISAGTIYHMGPQATLHPDMITDPANRLHQEAVNESGHGTYPTNPAGYAKIQGWQATFTALYRKEWIEAVGGWDENFPDIYGVDDIDLSTRIRIKLGVNQHVDNNMEAVHQYHGNGHLQISGNATERNMQYMFDKRLSVDGVEDVNNPNLIANIGKEWGVIKTR